MEETMIDPVETLIQAKDGNPAAFRDLVEQLGRPDRLENLVFNEGVRVQGTNPDRVKDCVTVIDRLRAMRQAS
jgi:hypothetical protein